eukprot:COSAG01_NODE_57768_length_310_cov_0.739336_1_plen_56_part_10
MGPCVCLCVKYPAHVYVYGMRVCRCVASPSRRFAELQRLEWLLRVQSPPQGKRSDT